MKVLQAATINTTTNNLEDEPTLSPYFQDLDSTCSTPYVSAPSSPAHAPPLPGLYYSAPASPMHFSITTSSSYQNTNINTNAVSSSEFEFSARFGPAGSGGPGLMSSADELFLNGQIRPMKLSTHLERPQLLSPLLDLEEREREEEEEEEYEDEENEILVLRGRDLRLRDKSTRRRRTRSMSSLRNNTHLEWIEKEDNNNNNNNSNDSYENEKEKEITTPCVSASSSSRSSSGGRSSKRWILLKEFLRSKSEGRSNNKFWSTISFSQTTKEKKTNNQNPNNTPNSKDDYKESQKTKGHNGKKMKGVRKRVLLHELHYKANRAQSEELRKKTFLPYRQGLLGCLGFSSKSYGAMNGFATALNSVSSR